MPPEAAAQAGTGMPAQNLLQNKLSTPTQAVPSSSGTSGSPTTPQPVLGLPSRASEPPPVIAGNTTRPPNQEDANLVPFPSSTPHEDLDEGKPQIPWQDQDGATWIYGKLYFRCSTETISENSKCGRIRIKWRPWTDFSINRKTGVRFKSCDCCRWRK
jgi:hypothetical protein